MNPSRREHRTEGVPLTPATLAGAVEYMRNRVIDLEREVARQRSRLIEAREALKQQSHELGDVRRRLRELER